MKSNAPTTPKGRYAALPRLEILIVAAVVTLLWTGPVAASCSDLIFRDDFELGGTNRWANSTDPPLATGTWTFSLDFSGTNRAFALELIQRSSGAVTGYLLGGTRDRVLVAGSVSGSAVSLNLEFKNPTATRSITIAGPLGRDVINATTTGDLGTQAVTLRRTDCELFEQHLAAAVDTGGGPEHLRVLSVVLDGEGAFVAGGFVGDGDCDLWACDGGLTSFTDVGDVLTVGLETDGGCSAGSSFTVSWDSGGLFTGTYSFTDCGGATSGNLIAATSMGTTSIEAREVLAARVAVANALETGVALTAPLDGVSSTYLNFGKDELALRAEINAEMGLYDDIEVDLERVREVFTRSHPRALPSLVESFGLKIVEWRTGVPSVSGGDPVTYLDTLARPIIDDFALVALEPGGWRVVGNQAQALDLPFVSTVSADGARLEAPTEDGRPVYISIGPYGAHFGPLTGDPTGEAKANFVGFLAEDDSDMEELEGDFDGEREPGEVWGYPVGGDPTGDAVRLRRPAYIGPADGAVTSVRFDGGPSPFHFDNEPQWRVDVELPGRVRFTLGHVGRIAAPLRALIMAATGADTDSFAGPVGTDILAGYDPISVTAGTELALPQILADPVPGHPGYWVGGGSFLEWPWAQIEFQVPFHLGGGGDLGGDFCVYRFLSGSRRDQLQSVMETDMLDPESQRYRDRLFYERWYWTAQGGLCQAENPLPRDFSDLYTSLGGWTERDEPATTVDEMFSFVPIDNTTAVYDSTNYDSAAVANLVIRNLQPGPYSWTMPDATTAVVFLAVGEVIERSADAMLIKWRDLNATNPVVYQRLAYRLDSNGLTIEWGGFSSTPGGALQPTLLPGDPCDDTGVLCYDHSLGSWPP